MKFRQQSACLASLVACIAKNDYRYTIAVLLYYVLSASICLAEVQTQHDSQALSPGGSVRQFLRTLDGDNVHVPEGANPTSYIAAFNDLNDDGTPEAIVYMLGYNWCGTGGCTTLILQQHEGSWKIVSQIALTGTPIRVLKSTSKGWHNIAVWVEGGGIEPGYEAELIFDGKTYPENPTVPPAHRLEKNSVGEVIIPSDKEAVLLYQAVACTPGEEACPVVLKMEPGAKSIEATGFVSVKHPDFYFKFVAKAGQKIVIHITEGGGLSTGIPITGPTAHKTRSTWTCPTPYRQAAPMSLTCMPI